MQGRLLPKYKGRYQAHPVGHWKEEFFIAKDLGLDCIEFILDFNEVEKNPLLNKKGLKEIKKAVINSGVKVKTVCADYFMEAPLHSNDELASSKSLKVLKELIKVSNILNITDIVMPCVDHSSLDSQKKLEKFKDKIHEIIPDLIECNVNLSLETDLEPILFYKLLESFNCERITVNYDIGNSASLGFNLEEELEVYGDRISDIHIKDRTVGGGSVVLGEGDANFETFFKKLGNYNYEGPFIMQAYRDEEGVEIFKNQLNWIKPFLF